MCYEPSMFSGGKKDVENDGGKANLETLLQIAREEYGLLSLTDVVLNHTANDGPWLAEHPEAGLYFKLLLEDRTHDLFPTQDTAQSTLQIWHLPSR